MSRALMPKRCILWTGYLSPEGYAKRGNVYIHREVYERNQGPIGDGLEIDHLCRNRNCIEVTHLEAVPKIVNILRGESPAAQHARQAECIYGHPFTATRKTSTQTGVGRVCRECKRRRDREYKRRKREQSLAS